MNDFSSRGEHRVPPPNSDVAVDFALACDGEWPPVSAERIRCAVLGDDQVRLLDAPRFVEDVSRGDAVAVRWTDGGPQVGAVAERGGHSTVRAVVADGSELGVLADRLRSAGADVTVDQRFSMLIVDVPPAASLARVRRMLDLATGPFANYAVSCEQHDAPDFKDLAAQLGGRLAGPADADWDSVRAAWNLSVDQRPAAVALPADVDDVSTVLRFATANGLRVAPQGGAHNAAPLGDLTGTILLRMTALDGVTVDAAARRVRVGAGAVWSQVTAALAGTGLATLAGSSPDVGVAGYLLGGGYSWLGRKYGLAVNSIRSAEIVTADGQVRTVSDYFEPDLFWALRGGNGNSLVVTEFELELFEVDQVYAGALLFPIDRAREVFEAYDRWTLDLDECVTSCVRLLRLPPLPELPEFLRGQAFAAIDGAIDADVRRADELLRPLRELGPAVDMWGPMPVNELAAIHMEPPTPTPGAGDGLALDELPIDALLEAAGPGVQTELLAVDIRHLGGAVSRGVADGGAVDRLPGRFLAFAIGITPDAATHQRVTAEVRTLVDALRPWAAERTYSNFSENSEQPGMFHAQEALWRLIEVQDKYDPERVIRANHALR